MSLFEDDFDARTDIDNEDGFQFGDIIYVNYYGINVFLAVCGVDHHRVCLYELAKKRTVVDGIHVEYLTLNLSPTSSPKIVLRNNCWTKSDYWARTTKDGKVELYINDGPLLRTALKLGVEYPVTGYVYAEALKEEGKKGICNYCWPAPVKKKKTLN